ncbi:uncharacterized protein N7511_011336 [Penicillium nucicola]|uniref:uncharacterized protein n=1 Tax=Penicillium nucicola TaxID=1850975 RepID=UPI0025454773|nr:uncharacterized protein N7511_011318 [Penicillium nucicola]XP_056978670.1 uncharacterized protein N7511_011336 [Penicillium nucicola]KAJ5742586.1 hypothetical protein N7511_011318 [Penicillium nucicola]KAJ5742604.1 hypothetical protein N7511_011336 [Penicillium nucicola]
MEDMTMSAIFCCTTPSPYQPSHLLHDEKFEPFVSWAKRSQSSPAADSIQYFLDSKNLPAFAVQLVQQVNYGALESKRYFIPSPSICTPAADRVGIEFVEVTEQDLITGNFQKLNSYKNFKCTTHNKFFEVNLNQKDPINQHHWRANIARPSQDIDLALRDGSCKRQHPTGENKNPKNASFLLEGEASTSQDVDQNATKATDPSILVPVLGFLLSSVRADLGSSSLVSLLYGWNITDASKSTSKTDVLEECLRKNKFSRGKPGNEEVEVSQKVPLDEDEELKSKIRMSGYQYENRNRGDQVYDYDFEPIQDYTACDKECGYCGNCDY